jgi:DHA2 family multidrug resistance protein
MSNNLRICLCLLIFFSTYNTTSSLSAGVYIVSALGGASEIAIYSVAFFCLGNALIFPLAEEMGRRYGNIQVLLFSLTIFTLATFLCSISSNFFYFTLARFFSGAFSGCFIPLSSIIIQSYMPPKRRLRIFIFIAFVATVIPIVSTSIGAWLAYQFHWSWIFKLQIPILFSLLFILYHHKTPHIRPVSHLFDWTGYAFYVLGTSCLVTGISLGQELDWFRSPLICVLLVASFLFILFFILWEWVHETPFFPLKLFKIPTFALSVLCVCVLYSAYFGMVDLLSLWLQLDAEYTPLWISIILLHMILSGSFIAFALKRWFEHMTSLWVVLMAIGFFGASCFYSQTFNALVDLERLIIARTMTSFGLAFFLGPVLLVSMKSLPTNQVGAGISIFQTLRLISAALGASAYTTAWIRRKVFYHERLGEQLTVYSKQTQEFIANLSFYAPMKGSDTQLLEKGLNIQADVLALADCFHLMGWIMVGLFVITFAHLMQHRRKKIALDSSLD